MAANIGGPTLDEVFKPCAVAGVEGARGFFVSGEIAGHGAHEAAGCIQGETGAAAALVLAAGLVNEAAQSGRGAVGLEFKPLPVAGQERDFAADHTQPGAAGTGARRRRQGSRQDFFQRAAEIEVHLLAGVVGKDKDWVAFWLLEAGLEDREDLLEGAGGNEGVAGKCGIG